MSPADKYYLDCGFDFMQWCNPYKTWIFIYDFEPSDYVKHEDRVLGGEVCMWSEFNNADIIEEKIWSRAGALADKLWGQKKAFDAEIVAGRLVKLEDIFEMAGVPFSPIMPRWCHDDYHRCFSRAE